MNAWNIICGAWHMLYGGWLVKKRRPVIAVLGGRFAKPDDPEFKMAYQLGCALAQTKDQIITGDGPGIMDAVSCGVRDQTKGRSRVFAVSVSGLDSDFADRHGIRLYVTNNFFVRDLLLLSYARAFVIFPGGYGTSAELFQILNLICLQKMPRVPIILVGPHFWQPLLEWLKSEPGARGLLWQQTHELVHLTNHVPEIMDFLAR